jgi:transglutaminase-like putative cysteine protease
MPFGRRAATHSRPREDETVHASSIVEFARALAFVLRRARTPARVVRAFPVAFPVAPRKP